MEDSQHKDDMFSVSAEILYGKKKITEEHFETRQSCDYRNITEGDQMTPHENYIEETIDTLCCRMDIFADFIKRKPTALDLFYVLIRAAGRSGHADAMEMIDALKDHAPIGHILALGDIYLYGGTNQGIEIVARLEQIIRSPSTPTQAEYAAKIMREIEEA